MNIPVKYIKSPMDIRFEFIDIILSRYDVDNHRRNAVMLVGGALYTLDKLERVLKLYEERL